MTEPRPRYRAGAGAAIGKAFEELLDWQHREYERQGLAVILFNGTRARARRGPDGTPIFVAGPSLPDYSGVLYGGRAVAFDAKTTANRDGWSWPRDRLHQRDTLSRLAGVGAWAFVLIECRPRRTVYLVPVAPGQVGFDPFPRVRFDEWAGIPADEFGHYDWLGG